MDDNLIQTLFALVRSALMEKPMSDQEKALYDPAQLPALYQISRRHDIAQIVGKALDANGLSGAPEIMSKFETQRYSAVFRYEQLNYVENELFCALEAAKIPFLPLKGSVVRSQYPHQWLRTSCDVDVLVPETELENAVKYLVENCGYTRQGKGSHDVALLSPDWQHVELHYTLVEDAYLGGHMLTGLWDLVVPKAGYQYWYVMPDGLFYYYHIAHMAKHFVLGGCGIRPLIDLWLLDKQPHDEKMRNDLLEQGGLLPFAKSVRRLSRVWLECAVADELSLQMQNYVLRGGVYGTTENLVKVSQVKQGGKGSYALSRIFLHYDVLKYQYPVLEKHRWLMPVCQVRRWCKLVLGGRLAYAAQEFAYNSKTRADQMDDTKAFLDRLGLLK